MPRSGRRRSSGLGLRSIGSRWIEVEDKILTNRLVNILFILKPPQPLCLTNGIMTSKMGTQSGTSSRLAAGRPFRPFLQQLL